MGNYLLISDAAKEVHVESHVLRYWEEELHLTIKRNKQGHRYYTKDDVERFRQIKSMKERGLQLKAIKMILKDGKLDVLVPENDLENSKAVHNKTQAEKLMQMKNVKTPETAPDEAVDEMAINIVESRELRDRQGETKEEKSKRLQWLLQQLIKETLQENNKELCREIKESVVKEMDYQFRVQEEREEERDKQQTKRNEEYYKRMDELLRKKSRTRKTREEKKNPKESIDNNMAYKTEKQPQGEENKNKKKRHFIF